MRCDAEQRAIVRRRPVIWQECVIEWNESQSAGTLGLAPDFRGLAHDILFDVLENRAEVFQSIVVMTLQGEVGFAC